MAKYELTISEDYVGDWDYIDGVREIFQNALDQEMEQEDNKMYFEYDEEREVLRIGNKTSVLDVSTLLLGATTKRDNDDLIGQFGEGYKIATLVLAREGHNVVFYNYGKREVWRPRFVNSRRYKARVLTFFVDRKFVWQSVPNNDLVIEIDSITKEKYNKIVESNLHLQDVGEVVDTGRGRILKEERYKGKVYVKGLYVCDYDKYSYGYDFKPEDIRLDRDRKLVSDFDLVWMSSNMWASSVKGIEEDIVRLVKEGAAEVEYIEHGDRYEEVVGMVGQEFIKEYGVRAVPVETQSEMEKVKEGYIPVIVPEVYKKAVKESNVLGKGYMVYKKTPKERLSEWLEIYGGELEKEAYRKLEDIITDIK